MRSLPALAALLLATFVPDISASAEVSVSTDDVRSLISEAADLRHALFAEAHTKEPGLGDFVNVTLLGGLPTSRFTIYLMPTGSGQFRAEIVAQDATTRRMPKPKIRRSAYSLSPASSRKIESLLNNSALWAEKDGRSGECTDQPIAVLEVGWQGKRKASVRMACAPSDLVGSLIDATLSDANRH